MSLKRLPRDRRGLSLCAPRLALTVQTQRWSCPRSRCTVALKSAGGSSQWEGSKPSDVDEGLAEGLLTRELLLHLHVVSFQCKPLPLLGPKALPQEILEATVKLSATIVGFTPNC